MPTPLTDAAKEERHPVVTAGRRSSPQSGGKPNAPNLPHPGGGFHPTFATIPAERFSEVEGRSTLYVGRARPEWFSVAAIRALPGKKITWAIGHRGKARDAAVAHAVERTSPGDLIVIYDDIDTADAWYLASLRADGVSLPWMRRHA